MKRNENDFTVKDNEHDINKLIYPILPYHIKYQNYMSKRNKIFDVSEISTNKRTECRRNTSRMRSFYRNRKMCRKLLISAVISPSSDNRLYARVTFLNYQEYGLLDTGANISCIGAELAKQDFSKLNNFYKCRSTVKTADGQSQGVVGWVSVEIEFRNQKRVLNLFLIPSISHRLILGIDFWNAFNLVPNILQSVDVIDRSLLEPCSPF